MTNAPSYIATAHDAAKAWTTADKSGAKGETLAILSIVPAFSTFEMTYKLDGKHKPVSFTFSTMTRVPLNENGKQDNAAISARLTAVATQFFGFDADNIPNAFKTAFNRALVSARYLVREGVTPTVKAGNLVVPMRAVTPAPKADASARSKAMYTAMRDVPVALDGKEKMTLAALRNNAVASDAAVGVTKKTRATKAPSASAAVDVAAAIRVLDSVSKDDNLTMKNAGALKLLASRLLSAIAAGEKADAEEAAKNAKAA